jgi:hypothetical protein
MSAAVLAACRPSPAVAQVIADLKAEFVAEIVDRAARYAQKAATSSRRGDRRATAVRLHQLCIAAEAARTFALGAEEDAP